jgi:protein-S-isoprenylcysteine O-methyltransferase Ste14
MPAEAPTLNRAVVFGSAVVYWLSVWAQARRVRRRIGRSPNVRPRGWKERLLWSGWFFVVVAWLALPWLTGRVTWLPGTAAFTLLVHPAELVLGTALIALSYAVTIWCYVAMGDAWRMGVDPNAAAQLITQGPYRFVRHPIYLSQLIMVVAVGILLPSGLSLAVVAIHFLCVLTKAADEEAYLRNRSGLAYRDYCAQTGAWFPRVLERKPSVVDVSTSDQDPLKPIKPPLR